MSEIQSSVRGPWSSVAGRQPFAVDRQPTTDSRQPNSAARLRETAKQLEGIFVEHLFKAMRETVPEGGVVDGGSGEEIFSGLLDSHLAAQVPGQWNDGLSEALVRQLRSRIQEDAGAAAPNIATPRRAETLR